MIKAPTEGLKFRFLQMLLRQSGAGYLALFSELEKHLKLARSALPCASINLRTCLFG